MLCRARKRSAPLLPRVCDKATPGWRRCGISPLRPLLRRSTASCTCAHVCGAWPALRAAKSCLPRIFTSPTSRNRDVSVLTWGGAHLSVIVRILRAHDARVLTPLNNLVCFLSLFRTFGTFGIPPLAARPAMAVPPAKGLDEACAWLHKAALTPFPPVTKLSRTTVTERTRLGRELNCGTSAASLSESSCLLHESRTNIIVIMTLRSPVESAHDSASRVGVRERLDLASAPASRRRTRLSLC